MMDLLTFVLFSTMLFFGKTSCQGTKYCVDLISDVYYIIMYDFDSEIQLQRPMYRVPENISLDRLVLKVCVEGADLEDKVYDVQIKTEQASTCFAIGKHLLSCVYS